jgi:hypothetical protein
MYTLRKLKQHFSSQPEMLALAIAEVCQVLAIQEAIINTHFGYNAWTIVLLQILLTLLTLYH